MAQHRFLQCAGVVALAFLSLTPIDATGPRRRLGEASGYHELCTLIALPWDSNTRVSPPALPATAGDGGATFQVTYTGFTAAAQTAFQRAVDIWSGLVSSAVPIRVSANFQALSPGVLGSAETTSLTRDFAGAPVVFT